MLNVLFKQVSLALVISQKKEKKKRQLSGGWFALFLGFFLLLLFFCFSIFINFGIFLNLDLPSRKLDLYSRSL